MTKVVLIRHGRSRANADGVLAGRADGVELDDVGREQARALAELFRDIHVAAAYRSPVLRCEQTATLAGWPDAAVEPGLDECDYGEWTNRPLKDLAAEPLWTQIQAQPSQVTFPGGESMIAMRDRAVAAVTGIAARHSDEEIVVLISHGDLIKSVLSHALAQSFDDFQRIVVGPASVSIVDFPRDRPPSVWCLNANADITQLLAQREAPTVGGGDIATPPQ